MRLNMKGDWTLFALPIAITAGLSAINIGSERWNNMELSGQEGRKATLTVDKTTATTDLGCRKNASGALEVFNVETGLTQNAYVVQGNDGKDCFFTDGDWRATGSTVYNGPIVPTQ